jgi:hypothetical protein
MAIYKLIASNSFGPEEIEAMIATAWSKNGSAMPQFKPSRKKPPSMGGPACPKCGARMWLAQISPDESGHERRTFECPICEISKTNVVDRK